MIPRATYRLQFHREFGFQQATQLVPYLAQLGVSHVYCSPYLKARPGSRHGYDIVDHSALNPEIGSPADFDEFVAALKRCAMGQLLDVVPNHMGVMGEDNAWWLDVLENGSASQYADFFDIDWDPISPSLQGKVLIAVLGDHYGEVLQSGALKLAFDAATGSFCVRYHDHRFPVDPRNYSTILERLPGVLNASMSAPLLDELGSLGTAFRNLPGREEVDEGRLAERNRDKEVTKRRLSQLAAECPSLLEAIGTTVEVLNGDTSDPGSFDALHELLEAQAYRLAYWRVASDEINYRRFFDINELAALRMENEAVFDATHGLVLKLAATGKVDGLRIDHPDGLFDPADYFRALQERHAAAQGTQLRGGEDRKNLPLYLVVEKITAGHERLPEDWLVHGTTGYRFLNVVNGLFIDPSARSKLDRLYRTFVNEPLPFQEIAYRSKRVIMRTALASELTVLSNRLWRLAQRDRRTRDFTLNNLRQALVEVVACFPVYRTYITSTASAEDRRYVNWAVSQARRRSRAADATVFDFVLGTLLGETPAGSPDQRIEETHAFARRFQQFTAPVTAKGVEDTATYTYHRLISLNEVGGDPDTFGLTVSNFHRASQHRAAVWPHTMLATSTHDNKRSEDVRARINVLSELPAAWRLNLRRWSHLNRSRKATVEGEKAPCANDEYLLYQTLLGSWPVEPLSEEGLAQYRERVQTYMTKAVREAKVHSSWINVNAEYESALTGFIDGLLGRLRGNRFLDEFGPFQRTVSWLGMLNSLSQTLIKLTSPGVPDTYQGNELLDFSLVDPDNRRAVDYALRTKLLADLEEDVAGSGSDWSAVARSLMQTPEDGRSKLFVTWRALQLRSEEEDLFRDGDYQPLPATGVRKENVVAYTRRSESAGAIVVAGRLFAKLVEEPGNVPLGHAVWGDTAVEDLAVPVGVRLVCALTGRTVSGADGRLMLCDLFADFPAALLSWHVEHS